MSAIHETDVNEPIQVLMTMHDNMNLLDFAGPLQVLTHAQHNFSDPGMSLGSVFLATQPQLTTHEQNPKPSTSPLSARQRTSSLPKA